MTAAKRLRLLGDRCRPAPSRPSPASPVISPAGHMSRSRGRKEPITVRGSALLDVEQHDDRPARPPARRSIWRTVNAGVRVGEDRGLGPHGDPGRDLRAVDLQRVALEPEGQLEVVDELQRIGPGLERAVLVAEDRGPAAHHVEEAPGLRCGAPARGRSRAGRTAGPGRPGAADRAPASDRTGERRARQDQPPRAAGARPRRRSMPAAD